MLTSILIVVGAYLIGSVSFAVVVSRAMGLPDPHDYGSGNPGATNVLRTGNRTAAALTLIGDGAKGWLRIEKLQGRKIKFQTIDFSHAPFQTHDFWVKVDLQGGLTLVP